MASNIEALRQAGRVSQESAKVQSHLSTTEERLNNTKSLAIFEESKQMKEQWEQEKTWKNAEMELNQLKAKREHKSQVRNSFGDLLTKLHQAGPVGENDTVHKEVGQHLLDHLSAYKRVIANLNSPSVPMPSATGPAPSHPLPPSQPPLQTPGAGPSTSASHGSPPVSHTPTARPLDELDTWFHNERAALGYDSGEDDAINEEDDNWMPHEE